MERQPKIKPFGESELFADGRGMRLPPDGTVAREHRARPSPPPITRALALRGRERFEIYCAACHGLLGDGDSVVGSKMSQRPPPSLHEPRLRAFAPAALERVIRDGYGLMPSHRAELDSDDRWAVVAYVRALQRSQTARLEDAPTDERRRLQEAP